MHQSLRQKRNLCSCSSVALSSWERRALLGDGERERQILKQLSPPPTSRMTSNIKSDEKLVLAVHNRFFYPPPSPTEQTRLGEYCIPVFSFVPHRLKTGVRSLSAKKDSASPPSFKTILHTLCQLERFFIRHLVPSLKRRKFCLISFY